MNNIIVTPKSNIELDSEGNLSKYTDEEAEKIAYKSIENTEFSTESEREAAWTAAYQSIFDTFKLIDPDDIGILAKTHVLMTMTYNPDSQSFESGITTRSEVYWDKRHCPAPAICKPIDLVWLEMPSTDNGRDDDDDDNDEIEEDPSNPVLEDFRDVESVREFEEA